MKDVKARHREHGKVLVTEGNSFLAIHIIWKLLEKGYQVRATLPPLCFKRDILSKLSALGSFDLERLTFIKADSNGDYNWDKALLGCRYVMYNSAAYCSGKPKNKFPVIEPTIKGIQNIAKSLFGKDVERIILSSYGKFTIEPHTAKNGDRVQANLTDIAAREAIRNSGSGAALTVIHSDGIFGPRISHCSSDWIDLLKKIVSGGVKQCTGNTFGVVDVRDLAELHILAMSHPVQVNEYFAFCSDRKYNVYDLVQLIRNNRPRLSGSISALLPMPSKQLKLGSNHISKNILNWNPKSMEEAVLSSVDSLFL